MHLILVLLLLSLDYVISTTTTCDLTCPFSVNTQPPALEACPEGSATPFAGKWCDGTKCVAGTCDAVPPPPPPPKVECVTCPSTADLVPNYLCADRVSKGGSYCNTTTCTWQTNNCDRAVIIRPGTCPASTDKVCITTNNICTGTDDTPCPDKTKCCFSSSSCGYDCVTPIYDSVPPPPPNPGYCPLVTITPKDGCPKECTYDVNCTTTQKCCRTDCGGTGCKEAVKDPGTTVTCTSEVCLKIYGTPIALKNCDDGSSPGPYCRNVEGVCKWVTKDCPAPIVTHDGYCPAVDKIDSSCPTSCDQDGSCTVDSKCCFTGCLNARKCTPTVQQKCRAAGYRKMRCLDEIEAARLFPDGEPSAPLNGDSALPEACYRCIEKAYCSSNGTVCKWSNPFFECMNKCTQPVVNPVVNPCDVRTRCACLNVTTPKCFWCQYETSYTDPKTNLVSTTSLGRCLNPTFENKCTGRIEGCGYLGLIVSTKPDDCSSTDISPNAVDPTKAIKDTNVADVIKQITDGTLTTANYQEKITAKGVTSLIINDFGSGSSDADGEKGKFQITFTNLDGTRALSDLITLLKDALETALDSKGKVVIDIQIYASTTTKRSIQQQTGTGDYVADTTVSAAPPTAGPDPAPQPGTNPTPGSDSDPTTDVGPKAPSGSSVVSPVWFLALLMALPLWS